MDGRKLDIAGGGKDVTSVSLVNNATYKPIPEDEMEEKPLSRPKSLAKSQSNVSESDRADERMLPEEETKIASNSAINIVDVKFINNEKQNGDAKVDIGGAKSEYVGLTKEELMKFANDPFWVRLRWTLFILFWALWAAMLVGAVLIIVAAPKCTPTQPKTWYETGPLVELDSVDTAASAALHALHADHKPTAVIVPLPGIDSFDLDDVLASNSSFAELVQHAHHMGMKVIVDVDPVATDRWFAASENRDGDYENYYVWTDASKGFNGSGNPNPPNNWLIENDNSAWKFSAKRNQFYLTDSRGIPQLNFRESKVVNEVSTVIRKVLQQYGSGDSATVFGFRFAGVSRLLVDESFTDEEINGRTDYTVNQYNFYNHKRTLNRPEIANVLSVWRKDLNNSESDEDKSNHRILMLKSDLTTLEPYTAANATLLVDLPQHSRAFLRPVIDAEHLKTDLVDTQTFLDNKWPVWHIPNTSPMAPDVRQIITFLLPGVPVIRVNESILPGLLTARESPSILYGSCDYHSIVNNTIFAFVRVHTGNPGYLVVYNPTDERVVIDFPAEIADVSESVTPLMFSSAYNETRAHKMDAHAFPMTAGAAAILTYVPKKD